MSDSADLYQAFFHTAGDAIFVFDAATKNLVHRNARALNVAGYRSEEITGLAIDRLFRPQNGVDCPAFFGNPDEAGRLCRYSLRLVRKNGETIAVNVSITPVKWGESDYLFMTARTTNAAWSEHEDFPSIIGQSEKIHGVCRLIGSVAKSEVTVLIQGESGTGKEIVANAIHAHSHRCRGSFVKVNCAALTDTLLESELFGHVRGAFTGAIRDRRGRFKQADGGTILLDEVGSMPLSGQAKLLRFLQEHEFEPVGSSVTTPANVRVIAATNADLAKGVADGIFRKDLLYYRLNVFCIPLPPLRDRKEDIPLLAQHFLHQSRQAMGKKIRAILPEALSLLIEHDWPGNVRELENAMEHAVIVEKGQDILPSSLPSNLAKSHDEKACECSAKPGLRERLNLLEKQILLDSLLRTNGIKKQAAIMLGIDPRNMPYLLRKHHLDGGLRPN
jgi:PAS domain S-box-containing protein